MIDLGIVSGGYPPRFKSGINHAAYARKMGLQYYLDQQLRSNLQTPHFHKLLAVLDRIALHDWIMWLDDDAFFVDFDLDVRRFIRDEPPEVSFVACRSPVHSPRRWVFLNSGVFFVRNDAAGRYLLEQAFSVPKPIVEAEWREDVYGICAAGEQAHLTHVIHRDNLHGNIRLHPCEAFNARAHHWEKGDALNKYPIVHFPGVDAKIKEIADFAERFGCDETLVPPALRGSS